MDPRDGTSESAGDEKRIYQSLIWEFDRALNHIKVISYQIILY